MTNVSDVNAMDVFGVIEKPGKEKTLEKYCVCISVGKNSDKYFYINSQHREMYDDFGIKASDYDFLEHDSYIGCSEVQILDKNRFHRKLGTLKHKDMLKILNKIRNSECIPEVEKEVLVSELEDWLENYTKNKLTATFNKR